MSLRRWSWQRGFIFTSISSSLGSPWPCTWHNYRGWWCSVSLGSLYVISWFVSYATKGELTLERALQISQSMFSTTRQVAKGPAGTGTSAARLRMPLVWQPRPHGFALSFTSFICCKWHKKGHLARVCCSLKPASRQGAGN